MQLRLESLLQCGYQSRLADPRLACKQDYAAIAFRRLLPAAEEQFQLLLTPYQGSKADLVLRLEPALHRAGRKYLPCLNWLGQALEFYLPQISVFKEPASEPSCARCDQLQTGLEMVRSGWLIVRDGRYEITPEGLHALDV